MEKKLVVVGEPEVLSCGGTRNNALNEILTLYCQYAAKVVYIGPRAVGGQDGFENGVEFRCATSYSKSSRLILSETFHVVRLIKDVLRGEHEYHIQFRVPSLFSLQIYWMLRFTLCPEKVSFYVAGDWAESLSYNYPGERFLRLLPFFQDITLRKKRCVFTGHKLLSKNESLVGQGHAFYSTTHRESDVKSFDKVAKTSRKGICFVGRLESLKNPMFFVKLASRVELRDSYVFFVLGDGPLRKKLERLVENAGLTNFHIMGHVNDRDKFYDVVNSCKYLVLPSYTEGTAKVLPELMSKGVVPIAFKGVGANSYILESAGGLIDVDSVDQAVEFISSCDADVQIYLKHVAGVLSYSLAHTAKQELDAMFEFIFS
ncbi:glycosyltransferase [Pseudomonas neustonica]|uniref:glycosyltransferase n=1 Tax=Pseudomonas neustonica TaxID=2487346 RepID=UPI003F484204